MNAVTNTTVRMIARVTIAGDAVRIRLDNTFGTAPLSIGKAYVGQRIQGAALAPGSNRQVSFNTSAQRDRSGRRQRHERSGADDRAGAAGPGGELCTFLAPACGRANTAARR